MLVKDSNKKKYKEYYVCTDGWATTHENGDPLPHPVYKGTAFASSYTNNFADSDSYCFVGDIFKACKFRYKEARFLVKHFNSETKGYNQHWLRPVTHRDILVHCPEKTRGRS